MKNLSVNVKVKQKFLDKVLFKTLLLLGSNGLITIETTLNIVNRRLKKGAFKFRVDKGKWRKLKSDYEIVLED